MEITLELVQALANVLNAHKLDRLELNGLVLVKSRHDAPKQEDRPAHNSASNEDIEDILFHSTSAPPLSLEHLASLTVTPMKKPKSKASNG